MPNIFVRAAAEGMPTINRRRVLLGTGATAVALAALVASEEQANAYAISGEREAQPGKDPHMNIATNRSHFQNTDHSDAELLCLGAEFDKLFAEYVELKREEDRLEDIFEEELEKAGYDQKKDRGLVEFFRVRNEVGFEQHITFDNEFAERIDEVTKEIRAIPAVTMAGIWVKARALRFDARGVKQVGLPDRDKDFDVECLDHFVAEIQQLAGA